MERFQPKLGFGETGDGRHDPLRLARLHRRGRRREADPRGRRAGGPRAAVRLPRWDLPHVRGHAALGADPGPAKRRGVTARRGSRCRTCINAPEGRSRSRLHGADRWPPDTGPQLTQQRQVVESPSAQLSDEQLETIGREFDAAPRRGLAPTSASATPRYIRGTIALQRRLVLIGRARCCSLALQARCGWLGTATLSTAKILENMEIGHNVMHGQWDWMNDPDINSQKWDWDTASTAEAWKHSHNYVHHTFTNIRGKDRDLGYEIMRIDPQQKLAPGVPAAAVLQRAADGAASSGAWRCTTSTSRRSAPARSRWSKVRQELKGDRRQGARGRSRRTTSPCRCSARRSRPAVGPECARSSTAAGRAPAALRARLRRAAWQRVERPRLVPAHVQVHGQGEPPANIVRNVWANSIIFCGHFPDQTYMFSRGGGRATRQRGGWYVRQLLGRGQHRGQPAVPRDERQPRLPGRAPPVPGHALEPLRARSPRACATSASATACRTTPDRSPSSWGRVQRTILRLAFPGGKPRPKPGPWTGETFISQGERELAMAADAARTE